MNVLSLFPVMKFHDLRCLISPSGARRVTVDLAMGAHVVTFALRGRNALAHGTAEIGSTLWPSPQSLWGWPPPPVLDKAPYEELPGKAGQLAAVSGVCPLTNLQVRKCFWFEGEALQLSYTLINRSEQALRVAPWEVTRVSGGLSFYPGDSIPRQLSVPDGAAMPAEVELADGHIWHRYEPLRQGGHYKVFGAGGPWLANFNSGLLFVKCFPSVPAHWLAPAQAAVEIYAHGDESAPYIELEQQGPWRELAAGEARSWQVSWQLEALLTTVSRERLVVAATALAQR